jgi:spore coat polysaccharide biosynthesis protein SpsF
MGSSRLPGKVLLKLDKTNTILDYVISQLKNCKSLDKIMIATTNLEEDKIITNFCKKNKITCFEGSSDDVLDRYYQCAKKLSITTIVRITSDCPLVDPNIIDKLIYEYTNNSFDVVATHNPHSFPIGVADIEIFSFSLLEKIWNDAKKLSEREHVTLYFYNNKNKFKIFNFKNNENLSKIKLAVDRNTDFELLKKIISQTKKRPILLEDILKILKNNPKFLKINSNFVPNEGLKKSLEEDKKFGF